MSDTIGQYTRSEITPQMRSIINGLLRENDYEPSLVDEETYMVNGGRLYFRMLNGVFCQIRVDEYEESVLLGRITPRQKKLRSTRDKAKDYVQGEIPGFDFDPNRYTQGE